MNMLFSFERILNALDALGPISIVFTKNVLGPILIAACIAYIWSFVKHRKTDEKQNKR